MGVTFERMYRRHAGDVYRYALVVMRNPQDAEDVTQTTFLNAYRAMEGGQEPEAPKNWLIAIAHNVCRQRFRQLQRRPLETVLREDVAETIVGEQEEGYSAEDIQRALGQLAFSQRSALVMRELEGRSYAEIAQIMELSTSAVETLIFRARRALREQLEGTLTCAEAERFLSLQADGELSRADRGQLRAHLRQCAECATLARKQRASRSALRGLWGGLPVPSAFLGGGGGVALATKAAAVLVTGVAVAGGGYAVEREVTPHPVQAAPKVLVGPGSAPTSNQVRAGLPLPAVPRLHVRAVAAEPGSRRGRNRVAEPVARPRRHTPALPAHASPVAVAAVTKPRPSMPAAAVGARRGATHVRVWHAQHVAKPKRVHPAHPVRPVRSQRASPASTHANRPNSTEPGSPPANQVHASPGNGSPPSTPPGQSQGQSQGHGNGTVAPEPVVPLPTVSVPAVTTPVVTAPGLKLGK